MPSDKYEFIGSDGSTLAGRLESPEGEAKAYAVFAHCFTCSKDYVASRTIANALASKSIATLRFDFTGLGNSEGDFSNTNFSSNVQDLICAATALSETHQAPQLMLGHSFGGAATLAASSQLDSVNAVATIAAPYDPAHVAHLIASNESEILERGSAEVCLFNRSFTIKSQFLKDIGEQNQKERLANLKKPLMVMHSPTDDTVGVENAKRIFDAAKHPKSFVSLDGIDHLLKKKSDAEYIATILAAWASRYID